MLCRLQGGELRLEVLNMSLFPLPEGSLTTTGQERSAYTPYAEYQEQSETAGNSYLTSCGTRPTGRIGSCPMIRVQRYLRSTILSLAP